MNELKDICATLQPVYIIVALIFTVVGGFNAIIMRSHEKRDNDKQKEYKGFMTRKNKEDEVRDKKINDIEVSLYQTFADLRVSEESDRGHRQLCEERHKEK